MSHYQMRTVEEQTVWHTSIPALSRSHTLHDAHAFCMREETRGGTCTPPQQQQMHSITTGNSYCTEHLRWLRYCTYCLGEVLDVGTDSNHVPEYPVGVKIPQITLKYTIYQELHLDLHICMFSHRNEQNITPFTAVDRVATAAMP